jgi:short-chain fatty acids transporter
MILARLASRLTAWSVRWIPDPLVIAVGLSILTFGLALAVTDTGPGDLLRAWGDGFWGLNEFAMQMCLIIVTGAILAASRPFVRLLDALAGIPRSPRGAIALMALFSMGTALFHWGLSLIGSAVFARHLARRQPALDYPLLIASAYLGMGAVWHAGFSGSVPLLVATPGHFLAESTGIVPITETIFRPFNVGLVMVVVAAMTLLAVAMHPPAEAARPAPAAALAGPAEEALAPANVPANVPHPGSGGMTPALRLEWSPVVSALLGGAGILWLAATLMAKGAGAITLNFVNFFFLTGGVLLHGRPRHFLRAAAEAGSHVWGVIIQFPLYAGIMGMMRGSGLADVIAGWFTRASTPESYPSVVLWYSAILNYFVPSGGSKWAIEGPYILEAARRLSVPASDTVLAYAWGEMVTDIIQPFWAIPLLAVAGLSFREIAGYGMAFCLVYALIVGGAFIFI